MSKISYNNLKLKVKEDVKTFNFLDNIIEIKSYLPVQDKNDLIQITLQKSKINGVYSPILLDEYFHLSLVYLYTNLAFTDKQKEDEDKIYNCLKSNGFIEAMLAAIPEEEYNELLKFLEEQIEADNKYNLSAVGVLDKIINDLSLNMENAINIVNNFDKNKYQEVIDFAKAANGGREIAGTK